MEKIIYFDKQGRLYLPEEVRRFLKAKTLCMRLAEKGILLEPLEDDPLKALSTLGKGKLKKSMKELKREAREEIEKHATKKIRRH